MAATVSPASVSRPFVVETADHKVFQFPNEETAADFEDKVREAGGGTLRLLPAASGSGGTLYDIEEHLSALADSTETVGRDQEQAFLADFQAALTAAADKRDRVGQFFAHCESQVALAQKEIERLQKRKTFYGRAIERMESYVTMVIVSLGLDAKGKYQKLEGHTSTFSVRRNPPSVIIADEAAVPAKFKSLTVTLPADLWESVVDSVPWDMRDLVLNAVKRAESGVSKTLVKVAIEEAVPNWKDLLTDQPSVFTETVPGAAVAAGTLRLVRG